MATFEEFLAIDMRVGVIREARIFSEARKPAYKLVIDFGAEIGLKRSSAQLTHLYTPEELVGQAIVGVVNFSPKKIAGFTSEVLVLGAPDPNGSVVLLQPERMVEPGARIY